RTSWHLLAAGHPEAELPQVRQQRLGLRSGQLYQGRARSAPGGVAGLLRHDRLERRDDRMLLDGAANGVQLLLELLGGRSPPLAEQPVDGRRIDVRGRGDAADAALPQVGEEEALA